MVVSKRTESKAARHESDADTKELISPAADEYVAPAETTQLTSGVPFSITDETTQHLEEPIPVNRKTAR